MRLRSSLIALAWVTSTYVTYAKPLGDISGCVNRWDAWGIACGSSRTCENAPNVILGK